MAFFFSNTLYRCCDDRIVWACAMTRTTWPLRCHLAPWKSNKALFSFSLWSEGMKPSEMFRRMKVPHGDTAVWVRAECMYEWKDLETIVIKKSSSKCPRQLACSYTLVVIEQLLWDPFVYTLSYTRGHHGWYCTQSHDLCWIQQRFHHQWLACS